MKKIGFIIAFFAVLMTTGCKKEYIPQKGETFCGPALCVIYEHKEGNDLESALSSLEKKYANAHPQWYISKEKRAVDINFPYDDRIFWCFSVFDENDRVSDNFFLDSKGCYYTLMPYSD